MDYPDGRYLVRHSRNELRVDPIDNTALQPHLQRQLDMTVRGFREDNDPNYM